MKNIKFRGKRIDNGEFIYGSYVFTYNCCYIIANEFISIPDEDATEYFIQVEPETVSQFSGLKDRTDNDIFENDKLFWNEKKYIVSFSSGMFKAEFLHTTGSKLSLCTVSIESTLIKPISTTEA